MGFFSFLNLGDFLEQMLILHKRLLEIILFIDVRSRVGDTVVEVGLISSVFDGQACTCCSLILSEKDVSGAFYAPINQVS